MENNKEVNYNVAGAGLFLAVGIIIDAWLLSSYFTEAKRIDNIT